MNIKRYFLFIKRKINRLDSYITNPMEFDDIVNPFLSAVPRTYVWIEEEKPKNQRVI